MLKNLFLFSLIFFVMGCSNIAGNAGALQAYQVPETEASWIRNGEPLEFEGSLWYPADDVESLLDSEVYKVGDYKGVQIFVEKRDVRPYNKLYTKFDRNQFRYFEKKKTE
ncbi:MAG: hypothetical protein HQL24_08140 [Candidatus Omnitrophica bacterium]|nr:hypothetical protein [Candidatus Omnitrophota bacterium]